MRNTVCKPSNLHTHSNSDRCMVSQFEVNTVLTDRGGELFHNKDNDTNDSMRLPVSTAQPTKRNVTVFS